MIKTALAEQTTMLEALLLLQQCYTKMIGLLVQDEVSQDDWYEPFILPLRELIESLTVEFAAAAYWRSGRVDKADVRPGVRQGLLAVFEEMDAKLLRVGPSSDPVPRHQLKLGDV